MSSPGYDTINSGPLLLRTYMDGSSNQTYILSLYDAPMDANHMLITSTAGVLTASDQPYFSSLMVSSLAATVLTASTLSTSAVSASTMSGSTVTMSAVYMSTMTGSTIQGINTTFFSTINTTNLSVYSLTISSLLASTLSTDQFYHTLLQAPSTTATFSSISFSNLTGSGTISAASLSTNAISTGSLAADSISTLLIQTTATASAAAIAAQRLQTNQWTGGDVTTNTTTVQSTLAASTLSTTNTTFNTVTNLSPGTVSISYLTMDSLYPYNLITANTNGTAFISLTATMAKGGANQFTFSTMADRMATVSTLSCSTVAATAVFPSSLVISTTALVSTSLGAQYACCTLNTLSTLVSTCSAQSMTFSTLRGSTLAASTILCAPIAVSSLVGSSWTIPTATISSLTGACVFSSMTGTQATVVTMSGSTITANTVTIVSSCIGSTTWASLVQASTATVSSLSASTVNGVVFRGTTNLVIGSAADAGTWNTGMGWGTLGAVSGFTNTAVGAGALLSLTSGSANTAVGYLAGHTITTGSLNTYLTCQVPSASYSGAYNELVVGGVGQGDHTATLGNPSTLATRLYGQVGIRTAAPAAALDVRGSLSAAGYQLTRVAPTSTVSVALYNNTTSSFQLSLNGSASPINPNAAILQNSNGLRVQNLFLNSAIGVNTLSPVFPLDIVGSVRATTATLRYNMEAAFNSTIVATAPSGGSLWLGADPVLDIAMLCASNVVATPIGIQTRGGRVGIGTLSPAYDLDVQGNAAASSVIATAVNTNGITVNGMGYYPTQWTVSSSTLSYGQPVNVTGTVTATNYNGLPTAAPGITGQMGPPGAGLTAAAGVLSVKVPYFFGIVTGVSGGAYTYSAVLNNGFTVATNYLTAGTAGYYLICLGGQETTNDTVTILTPSDSYVLSTGTTPQVGTTVIIHILGTDHIRITTANGVSGSQHVMVRWLATY